jgi:hypothetical protein
MGRRRKMLVGVELGLMLVRVSIVHIFEHVLYFPSSSCSLLWLGDLFVFASETLVAFTH